VGGAQRGVTAGAIVLARGLGTRMRRKGGGPAAAGRDLTVAQAAAADAGQKAMMPVGRPLVEYILSALADAGVTDVCLVIGPGSAPGHDAVRDHFASAVPRRVRLRFAEQEQPLGTADAVGAAENVLAAERFLVINGDNYYPADVLARLAAMDEPSVAAFTRGALMADGSMGAERIARFALLEVGADGYLRRIVEKPDALALEQLGPDAPVSMNCWLFDRRIFAACRAVQPSARGELELPLAVHHAIDERIMRVRAVPVAGSVLDLSGREDVATVTARLQGITPRP
jgi:dTDP-glucose pyrophosphorylase